MNDMPYLIKFQTIGSKGVGFLSVAQNFIGVPFEIKRVYWTYKTPTQKVRGRHAHKKTHQVLVAVSGKITVNIETNGSLHQTFILENPQTGLLIPNLCWEKIKFSKGAVLLVLSSSEYDASEYIRNYREFKQTLP